MVCASVRGDNPRALDTKSYNNLLIAPACICNLCMERFFTLNIGLSMKDEKYKIMDFSARVHQVIFARKKGDLG